ncbi:MAG: 5-aminolevulinate synthase [Alphaproteobacteria bacterium]|jgi:5-aminolevulinate synthase|nr:5-aminolevulinate synthase [Alphaproteobacteria bacterium]
MAYDHIFSEHLSSLKAEGRYRIFADLERLVGEAPYALWHSPKGVKKVIVWCTNDYLGMSQHPAVIEAMVEATRRYGAGSGGTRNISGTAHSHVTLEQEVADLHGKEKGLIFTSGYIANEATISTLAQALPDCVILSDEKNHASIIQGIRASGCERRIFRHNDLADLREKLSTLDPKRPKLIAFISVYSMDGDIAPIEAICDLADEFNAMTYLDEVHAVGLYGPQGAGIAAQLGLQGRINIIQANFAKAYGVMGGYITGSIPLVDYVRSAASGFIFTTSLPPAVVASAYTSMRILRQDTALRDQLWSRVGLLKQRLEKSRVPCQPAGSHILPVVVGNAGRCQAVCDLLREEHNIYVQPINYPTVPRGQERIRLTVTPSHTLEMIQQLGDALEDVWHRLNLYLAA